MSQYYEERYDEKININKEFSDKLFFEVTSPSTSDSCLYYCRTASQYEGRFISIEKII